MKTSKLRGSSKASPDRKYYGLWIKTPLEQLSSGDIIISVGTKFEADSLKTKILHQPIVEVEGTSESIHLLDIKLCVESLKMGKRE